MWDAGNGPLKAPTRYSIKNRLKSCCTRDLEFTFRRTTLLAQTEAMNEEECRIQIYEWTKPQNRTEHGPRPKD